MAETRTDCSCFWLHAGYESFAEAGTAGLNLNKLALRVGLPRQNFRACFPAREQFLFRLFQEHRRRVTCLYPRVGACSSYDPDLFQFLTRFPTEIRFHRHFLLVKKDEASLRIYRKLNAKLNAAIYPLWAQHVDYSGDPEDGKSFHLTLMDLWLLHLDPRNLSLKALIKNAESINRWLVWFRNGDMFID